MRSDQGKGRNISIMLEAMSIGFHDFMGGKEGEASPDGNGRRGTGSGRHLLHVVLITLNLDRLWAHPLSYSREKSADSWDKSSCGLFF